MVFQFEHLGLMERTKITQLMILRVKEKFTKWQKGLEAKGWNALFLENHDQTRSVSSWGNDKEYWNESAKC